MDRLPSSGSSVGGFKGIWNGSERSIVVVCGRCESVSRGGLVRIRRARGEGEARGGVASGFGGVTVRRGGVELFGGSI